MSQDETIENIKASIAQKTTFYSNSDIVPAANALNDVNIYYTNGSTEILLTTSALNSLSAGTYNLILKYHNTAATGGSIILKVAESVSTSAEINITLALADAPEWDWVYCAEMIANARRIREGSAKASVEAFDAVLQIYLDTDVISSEDDVWEAFTRVSLADTAKAARFIYTNGTTTGGLTFRPITNTTGYTEDAFYDLIAAGKPCVLLLKSVSSPDNMNMAKYVVLCGVNKSNHTYKIIDPITENAGWYPSEGFYNGNAMGNSDLIFTCSVVEFR